MKMRFKYDADSGEAKLKKLDALFMESCLAGSMRVEAIDYLTDIVAIAQQMIDDTLNKVVSATIPSTVKPPSPPIVHQAPKPQRRKIVIKPVNKDQCYFRSTQREGRNFLFMNGRMTSTKDFNREFNKAVKAGSIDREPTHIEDSGAIKIWRFK